MTIGQKIKAARLAAGLTQIELSEKMGVNRSYISQYEKDLRSPSFDTLDKFAAAIGCSLLDLLPLNISEREALSQDPDRNELLRIYEQLNQEGRHRLSQYAADLSSIDRYRAE